MASMANSINFPHDQTPSSPSQFTSAIQLSGFLSGDTIQVQGDTHNLQFSVQFNIHPKHNSDNQSPFPTTITPEKQTSLSSSSSSYKTPIVSTQQQDDQIGNANENTFDWIPNGEEFQEVRENTNVVTRLRSGILSPVNYYPRSNLYSWEREKRKRGKGKGSDVLERVLRRHSFPIRPCCSYSFFVMANWGLAKSSSFREKSKKLGEMWCKLPQIQKQVFEDIASKDNARYKRQCMRLMCRKR